MKTIHKLSILLILFTGIISCDKNDDKRDFSSPNLELITKNLKTKYILKIGESTSPIKLNFENAQGAVSYIWTIDGKVISEENNYIFKSSEVGIYNLNVYAEDTIGKYTNQKIVIIVKDAPYVFDTKKVVVGYFLSSRSSSIKANKIKWKEITHFIYSFVYPKKDGTLDIKEMTNLTSYVKEAKKNNVKVLVSVGGAFYTGKTERIFTKVLKDDKKRATLVKSIADFVKTNNLDGIDIDYEELVGGSATVANTTDAVLLVPFFQELRKNIKGTSLLTAAVTGGYGWAAYHFKNIITKIADETDFISIMSYDNTGTWDSSPLGPHSSFKDAKGALAKYKEFGVSKDKLVLGVPFYGRDFKTKTGGTAEPITYNDIITTYSPTSNELKIGNINRDGHNIFFNSQEIISQKTKYTKDQGYRGITIWELGQNTTDENTSLLKNILGKI